MTTCVSRSAIVFLRRSGLRSTPRLPMPRLGVTELHAQEIPLKRDQLDPNLMLDAGGHPPPDRGRVDLWPPPQEVETDASPEEFSQ